MKKALSLILSLLMLVGLLAMPVSAASEGSKDNPIYVPMGKSAPTSLTLGVGESVYYQLKAAVFHGYSVIVENSNAVITVDGVRYDEKNAYSFIDYGIKVELDFTPMSPAIVCFTNEGEEPMEDVTVTWKMPVGTANDPLILEEGATAVSIPASYPLYYAMYVPTASGKHTLNVSDFENFMVWLDTDGDLTTDTDWTVMTKKTTLTLESYIPVAFVVQPVGPIPDVTLTVTAPAKGSKENPYWLGSYDEIRAGLDGSGKAQWPAEPYTSGVYYTLNGEYSGNTLEVRGYAPLKVTINGKSWSASGTDAVKLSIPLKLTEEQYSFDMHIKGSSKVKIDILFPVGHENNPKKLAVGKNTLPLSVSEDGFAITYYAIYTATQNGVLLVTPGTIEGLGYADATNMTTGESDFITPGWYDDEGNLWGASEDNVLTIPVKEGEKVKIGAFAGENENFEVVPTNLTLNVAYKPIKPATITTQPATANYAKEGETVKVSVKATGDGLTYAWYIKNAGASKYSKSSVTSSSYSAKMSDKVAGRRVYCIVTDKYGNSVQSTTAILRRQATITTEPATAAYAQMGKVVSVKIGALGDGLTYTWYIKNAGGTKYSKSSVTTATYTATMSDKVKDRRVYCIVTDKYGKTVQSKTFILREGVSITKEPATAIYAKNGDTAKATITASGDGLTYTWYIKNAGGTKYSKSSVTSKTYSVKMSDKVAGRRVYCIVKDKYGNTVQSKTMILKAK